MKLIIFGSTGGTGRELLKQALEQGHDAVAYARNPARIDDIKHANLQVVRGDVLDPAAVESAVAGQEVVLSTIGAGAGRTTLREDGTRNIVEAMERTGVKRLISQSSLGVGDSRANLSFFTKYVIVAAHTGAYRHGFPTTERRITGKISRADVADFMLKQLTDDTYLHQTPGVSY
jgi:putative NADH-flavin reductase